MSIIHLFLNKIVHFLKKITFKAIFNKIIFPNKNKKIFKKKSLTVNFLLNFFYKINVNNYLLNKNWII